MGRRRRRVIRVVKKKLPTVFVCPRCGEEAVRVSIAKDTGRAVVLCAQCQLKDEFPAHPAAQMIDVYSYFTDRFYGVKDPRPIIPREREAPKELSQPRMPEVDTSAPETAQEPSTETVPEPAEIVEPSNEAVEESHPIPPATEEETLVGTTVESSLEPADEKASEAQPPEEEAAPEEESEPFADILENKEKKRYSPNPLPQKSSE